jgi:hypothetical protein
MLADLSFVARNVSKNLNPMRTIKLVLAVEHILFRCYDSLQRCVVRLTIDAIVNLAVRSLRDPNRNRERAVARGNLSSR